MSSMTAVLLTGAALAAVTFVATMVSRHRRAAGRDARRFRRGGAADPYAGQRKPDKLNPGLGGSGSGGGCVVLSP
jgi:hypothetical protein